MRRDTSDVWSIIVTHPGIPDDSIFVDIYFHFHKRYKLVMLLTCGMCANSRQGDHNRSRWKRIKKMKILKVGPDTSVLLTNFSSISVSVLNFKFEGESVQYHALVTFQSLFLMRKCRSQTVPQIDHPLSRSGYINILLVPCSNHPSEKFKPWVEIRCSH